MENNKASEDDKQCHKKKLFEDISKITQDFSFIESYYRDKNNLQNLSGDKLKMYIDILYQRYKDYEKLNNFEKIQIIRTQYMNQILNNILDLIILKEIQAEKEKFQNIPIKKSKKPLSGKNKVDNNISKESIEPKVKKMKKNDSMENIKIDNKHIIKEKRNSNINIPKVKK